MIAQVRRSPSSPNGSSDTPGRSSSRLRLGAAHPPIIPALAILAAWLIGLALEGGWL